MELLVEAQSWEHALFCIENNIDNLILGNELFSTRISYNFNESEMQQLINNRKNTKIWIKVNKFFFDNELYRLEMYLNWLATLDIEKIIFQDFAVCELIHEANLNLRLHYNPESLVTSYGQFDFYLENNINSVFLARELTWNELEKNAMNKKNMQITIQVFGYGFIMHSRWKLITNFIDHYHLNNLDKDLVTIKETLRKLPNIIFQDNHGTHMLTGYVINAISLINEFKTLNIDYLLVDFLKLDSCNHINEITLIYQNAIRHEQNNYEEDENKIKSYLKDKICAKGFFNCPKEVLHLEKEDKNEQE